MAALTASSTFLIPEVQNPLNEHRSRCAVVSSRRQLDFVGEVLCAPRTAWMVEESEASASVRRNVNEANGLARHWTLSDLRSLSARRISPVLNAIVDHVRGGRMERSFNRRPLPTPPAS